MAAQKKILLALNQEALVWPSILRGVRNYSMLHPDVQTHVQLFLGDPDADRRMFRSLLRHSCPAGVLTRVYWPVGEQPLPAGLSLVNLDDEMRTSRPTVMNDQILAGRMAAEHLLEQHIVNFAYAAAAMTSYGAKLRLKGFQQRLREAGHSCTVFSNAIQSPFQATISDETLRDWVTQLPKPVGIHVYTLALAARLSWACREGGLEIPRDVALIGGMDNPTLATALEPMISAIAFDELRVGYESIRVLHNLLRGAPPPGTAPLHCARTDCGTRIQRHAKHAGHGDQPCAAVDSRECPPPLYRQGSADTNIAFTPHAGTTFHCAGRTKPARRNSVRSHEACSNVAE